MSVPIQAILTVNGVRKTLPTDPDRPLLEVLREDLHLTGSKYGCGEGACGACTVLIDGKPAFSCSTPVSQVNGKNITTIESLARDGQMHPVQRAFMDENAFQCGYCTGGMIMATVAFLKRKPDPTDIEIRQALQGHLCRCCTYPRIVDAVHRAAELSKK